MSNQPGQGFLGRPKEAGEERERQCDKCRKVTWQTYHIERSIFTNPSHMWHCNLCGRNQHFDI